MTARLGVLSICTAPAHPAAVLLERLGGHEGFYLLESAGSHPLSRYVLAGIRPRGSVRVERGAAIDGDGVSSDDLWGALSHRWGERADGPRPPWPVARSVGYLGYEMGRYCDRFPKGASSSGLPDAVFSLYDAGYVLDQTSHEAWVWGASRVDAHSLLDALDHPCAPIPGGEVEVWRERDGAKARYLEAVERVLEYIAAGDIYQANVSRRFRAPLRGSPLSLYRELLRNSPAPFGAYVDCGPCQLLSTSPERFLYADLERGVVETRPIKGTIARISPGDDAQVAALRASRKDLAEHTMIVDLLRNDLGRVCASGSVHVERFAMPETFAHLHHLVSVVRGRLRGEVDLPALVRATFPGGSITGAPKIRAIEIISEVEGTARGPAYGAFGYVDLFGRVELALAIRTAVATPGWLELAVGGGIVADSDPAAEYAEASLKGRGFLRSAQSAD